MTYLNCIDDFKVPQNQMVVEQIFSDMELGKDGVVGVVTRHKFNGQFTLFLKKDGEYIKAATGSTPEFSELEELDENR